MVSRLMVNYINDISLFINMVSEEKKLVEIYDLVELGGSFLTVLFT